MKFQEALNEKKKMGSVDQTSGLNTPKPETETMKDLIATWKSGGKKQFSVWHHQYITKI